MLFALGLAGLLAREGKHEKAIAELETAIEINPAGSRAYSELGWALFKTADYTRANKITLTAVRLAIEPNVRAASLYNLGRIAEENGDVDAALGVEASAAFAPAPPCTEPSDKKTLCKCLLATIMGPQWLNEPCAFAVTTA